MTGINEPASWQEVKGIRVPACYSSLAQEVRRLRDSVALSDRSHVVCVRVLGDDGYDWLERLQPLELYINDGQLAHSLFLRPDGTPMADVYICNDNGDYLLLIEGMSQPEVASYFAQSEPEEDLSLEWLHETHTLLSLNGPFAWEVLSVLEGPAVIGFPYMTFYKPTPERMIIRTGKTGEFGYDLLVPLADKEAVWSELLDVGDAFAIEPVGFEALEHCAFENFFYSPYRAGFEGLTALSLQLQWRLSAHKDFSGAEVIKAEKERADRLRVTAFVSDAPVAAGATVFCEGEPIGTVCQTLSSITLARWIGFAALQLPYAHSGISGYVVGEEKQPIHTVSPPFVNNKSLMINPRKHNYQDDRDITVPVRILG